MQSGADGNPMVEGVSEDEAVAEVVTRTRVMATNNPEEGRRPRTKMRSVKTATDIIPNADAQRSTRIVQSVVCEDISQLHVVAR